MKNHPRYPSCKLLMTLAAAATGIASPGVGAQTSSGGSTAGGSSAPVSSTVGSTGLGTSDPTPYYIGASQGFTHDSNVYRIPSGPSDNFSSTSVFGGFDQTISRQRINGRANVSANRYQDQDQLNNVSYNLNAGLVWETIERLSGNVDLGANRNLAAPAASAGVPGAHRNVADSENIDTRVRWGGASLLTLEASAGYSRLDYSAPEYVSAESRQTSESLTVYYRPGGLLRLGLAGRVNRTETPKAFIDTGTGEYRSSAVRGKNIDLLADYDLSGHLSTNARLSYTKQTNSRIGSADFSGLTGSINVNWRVTDKTAVHFDAARDAGFDTSSFSTYTTTIVGTTATLTPMTIAYENNRVTNSLGVGASYAATAKINATTGVRYVRAKLLSTASGVGATPDTTDALKSAYIGASYSVTRSLSTNCNLSHEKRDVSGGVAYSYKATAIGCSAQFILR